MRCLSGGRRGVAVDRVGSRSSKCLRGRTGYGYRPGFPTDFASGPANRPSASEPPARFEGRVGPAIVRSRAPGSEAEEQRFGRSQDDGDGADGAPKARGRRSFLFPRSSTTRRCSASRPVASVAATTKQYEGVLRAPMPAIPGHEPLGIIEAIGGRGPRAAGASTWGDRVAVEDDALLSVLSGLSRRELPSLPLSAHLFLRAALGRPGTLGRVQRVHVARCEQHRAQDRSRSSGGTRRHVQPAGCGVSMGGGDAGDRPPAIRSSSWGPVSAAWPA